MQFYQRERRMPTYSEMMRLFGFKSKNAVYRVVEKLVEAGVVAKDRLGRLVPSELMNEIPLVGSVKAGFPSAVEEVQDFVDIGDFLIPRKGTTYLVRVDGNSMIDAHIADGDLVIAERVENYQPKDKEIVIAEVDGETTLKYFRKDGAKVWLDPANKAFKPIHPTTSLEVRAIVKGVIRKY